MVLIKNPEIANTPNNTKQDLNIKNKKCQKNIKQGFNYQKQRKRYLMSTRLTGKL